MLGRDGTWRYCESTLTDLRFEPSVEGIVITTRDIDALKLALKKMEAEKSELLSYLNAQSRQVRQYLGTGNREYLTGISTGALAAPFAFLGSAYDSDLRAVYTQTPPDRVLRKRSLLAALLDDAMADNAPDETCAAMSTTVRRVTGSLLETDDRRHAQHQARPRPLG